MILKKLYIENFGKLHEVEVDLTGGLNEFCEENGFGKTTLSIFIKAMFYGMPAARDSLKNERKKYMPWQGGNFGGFIEYESAGVNFRLTRFFAKTPEGDSLELLNLSTNKLVMLKGLEPGEMLFNVGKDSYEKTAFFPQLNFSEISNRQISANILGLEKFKYDLANLNTAVSQIKKKITELKREKPKKEEVTRLKLKLQENHALLDNLQKEFEDLCQLISKEEKELAVLNDRALAAKNKYDFQMSVYMTKQKFEECLLQKQNELNKLLVELNEINSRNQEIQPTKTEDKKKQYTKILLAIFAAMFAVGAILLGVYHKLAWSIFLAVVALGFIFADLYLHSRPKCLKEQIGKAEDEQFKNLKRKIVLCEQEISMLAENLKAYSSVNKAEFEVLNKANSVVYQQKLELQNLINKRDLLVQKMDNLQDDIDEQKDFIFRKEEEFSSAEKKINLLNTAKEFLEQANENVSARFVEPANKAIKEVLTKFDMRNRNFVVNSNFDINEVTAIGIKEQEYSSQGYQDILAFCVRVYLLKEIYKKEKPPIILDDTFVNLDDENLSHAKSIVNSLTEEYQILYFCCHSRCKLK